MNDCAQRGRDAPAPSEPTALVIGATSDIGRAIASALAREGWALQLAARDRCRLDREARDLRIRTGASVTEHVCNILDTGRCAAFVNGLEPLPRAAICVVGMLGNQRESERAVAAAELVMRTNYTAPALLMGALAERFARRGEGTLVGVSSVAGDRGRGSNYVYGSAKAGFTAFLSGLRNRLAERGVHAATVKPGFVRTRMTDGLRLPPILTAEADEVAAGVVAAIRRKRDVLYVRPIWRPIMAVIACIPERMFKRLRL